MRGRPPTQLSVHGTSFASVCAFNIYPDLPKCGTEPGPVQYRRARETDKVPAMFESILARFLTFWFGNDEYTSVHLFLVALPSHLA